MPDRWRRVEELYHAALAVEADRREAFLDAACGTDQALREELDSLLASKASGADWLREPARRVAAELVGEQAAGALSGRRLGGYAVESLVGAGGMGEVYRARDTKLGREVAIKVLPARLATDPERVARFRREARLLASLNHANIAAIYSVDEAEGIVFLVLELVPGPTLAERIAAGPLPLAESLRIAGQIADALGAAHEKGILHRDLKPANVKLTPDGKVKILDFGLAKALESEGEPGEDVLQTSGGTRPGMILGTPAYMSPEQARGQEVDLRTDVWAFGCVVYECLAGKRAFGGDSSVDVLNSIVGREPDWEALPAETPPGVRALLGRCLRKDPAERLRHIVDARIWLEESSVSMPVTAPAIGQAAAAPARWRERIAWAVAALAVAVAGVAVGMLLRDSRQPLGDVVRVPVGVGPAEAIGDLRGEGRPCRTAIALSPDGRTIVFSGMLGGKQQLYLRPLDRLDAAPIAGTEGGDAPFFSPDGRWIGFWTGVANGGNKDLSFELKKVPLDGSPPTTVCRTKVPFGASWGADGGIVFATFEDGLWRVPASGGTPQPLTTLDTKQGEISHRLPQVLPGAKAVLFTITKQRWRWDDARIVARSLVTGEQKVLAEGASDARYVSTGHLVYARNGTVMARAFDPGRLEVAGGESALLGSVMQAVNMGNSFNDTGAAQLGISETGTLLYVPGGIKPEPRWSLVWVDRNGDRVPLIPEPGPYWGPRLSPDGRRVAFLTGGLLANRHVWIHDVGRGGATRLTADGEHYYAPVWTPDGRRVVFSSRVGQVARNLFWQPVDGSGPAERLTTSDTVDIATSWSPDGTLVFDRQRGIWLLSLEKGVPKSRPLLQTKFFTGFAAFSPNGRWLAYTSDESGRTEVYVRAFPGPGGRYPVSIGGGISPVWARNGREIFYTEWNRNNRTSVLKLMAVDVTTSPAFTAGRPRMLFAGSYLPGSYDVALDGRRFLMVDTSTDPLPPPVTQMVLVVNWLEELKRRTK